MKRLNYVAILVSAVAAFVAAAVYYIVFGDAYAEVSVAAREAAKNGVRAVDRRDRSREHAVAACRDPRRRLATQTAGDQPDRWPLATSAKPPARRGNQLGRDRAGHVSCVRESAGFRRC
jgi:hypothetical protein